jgi:cytochrome c-type biogenesis protein CcmH/NrfG
MEPGNRQPKLWTNVQTYTMAAICLSLGVAVGYLVHAPANPASEFSVNAVAPSQPAPSSMPTAQDLKRMADKQVAPLLAELQKNPKNPDLLAQIGRSYLAAQQYQTAEQYYEQSVSIKATPDTLNEMSFVSYSLGDVDRAIELLNRAQKMDPKNTKVLYNLGMFEWRGKSDPKAAIAAWREFLRVSPNDAKREQVEKMIAQAKEHLNIAPGTRTDKPAM